MKLKRTLCLLLICVLLCGLFSGCGRALSKLAKRPLPTRSTKQTETKEPSGLSEYSTEYAEDPATEPSAPATEPSEPVTEPTEPSAPAEDGEVHPMLFRVTGPNGQEMYLFGTIHAGDDRMDTALEKLTPVLDGCDALAVEFDVVAYEELLMTDMQAQLAYYQPFLPTDGTTVDQHMPAELYARAEALLKEAGLMPGLMKNFNLAMWSQLVSQAALMTRSTLDFETGMDRRLIYHCYEKQIEVRDVESAELQTNLLAGFPDELNLLMIESTLDSLDTYGEELNELYEAWLGGNYDEISALLESENEADTDKYTPEQIKMIEDYNRAMLDDRNLGMRDRAVEWLKAGDKVFFAVGAAHLVGEAGLVELLRAAGYTVEQVQY